MKDHTNRYTPNLVLILLLWFIHCIRTLRGQRNRFQQLVRRTPTSQVAGLWCYRIRPVVHYYVRYQEHYRTIAIGLNTIYSRTIIA